MELSSPKIKKFLIFFQKKVLLIFGEMKVSSSKRKKLLNFSKKNLIIFQEGIFKAQKTNF